MLKIGEAMTDRRGKWIVLIATAVIVSLLGLIRGKSAPAAGSAGLHQAVTDRREFRNMMRKIQEQNAFILARVTNPTLLHRGHPDLIKAAEKIHEFSKIVKTQTKHAEVYKMPLPVWNRLSDAMINESQGFKQFLSTQSEPSVRDTKVAYSKLGATCIACHRAFEVNH
jgi:hypothetical protein